MSIKQLSVIVAFLILLLPSTVFGEKKIGTGYDLYENIKLMGTAKSPDAFATVMFTMGYLDGCLDGLIFMQDVQYNNMFPPKVMTAKEREKFSATGHAKGGCCYWTTYSYLGLGDGHK